MSDEQEQTEAAPSMSDLLRTRNTMAERQRANFERLFGPPNDTTTDTEPLPDDDGDAA